MCGFTYYNDMYDFMDESVLYYSSVIYYNLESNLNPILILS